MKVSALQEDGLGELIAVCILQLSIGTVVMVVKLNDFIVCIHIY